MPAQSTSHPEHPFAQSHCFALGRTTAAAGERPWPSAVTLSPLEFVPHLYADGARLNERHLTGLIGTALVAVVGDASRVAEVIAVQFRVVVSIVQAEMQLERVVHRQLDVRFEHGDG